MIRDFLKNTEKNIVIIFILVLIMIIISFVFDVSGNKNTTSVVDNPVLIKEEPNVVDNSFESRRLKIDDKYVTYDIKYPYFYFTGRDFNNKIKDFIQVQAEAHGINSKDNWQSRYNTRTEENISEFPNTDEEKYYFFSDFKIVQSNSKTVSLVLTYGGYNGGAHGYENRVSFAYDLENRREIELKDLFSEDDNYLEFLSEKTKSYFRDLLEKNVKENFSGEDKEAMKDYINNSVLMIEEGTKPELKNFSVFTFNKDKITIYFGQYQVGPYAEGMQEVEITREL